MNPRAAITTDEHGEKVITQVSYLALRKARLA